MYRGSSEQSVVVLAPDDAAATVNPHRLTTGLPPLRYTENCVAVVEAAPMLLGHNIMLGSCLFSPGRLHGAVFLSVLHSLRFPSLDASFELFPNRSWRRGGNIMASTESRSCVAARTRSKPAAA